MIESSTFSNNQPRYDAVEPMSMQGGTCDAYRVKLYGKLHFLKRLKPPYANDIRHREALRKEFETGYRLEHPQLPRYLSFDGDAILMEYIDGETLTQRLSSTPDYFLDKKHVSKLLDQLLSVMAYLHSQQVLHLDLKPDNIMLTRIGNDVKLIDLGCCLTDTYTDTTGRTDRYAAPEQLHGGSLDARTDIYAIGKVLSELPYHSHLYDHVIKRCTAPKSDDRYASIGEIKQELIRNKKRSRNAMIALSSLVALSAISIVVWLSIPSKTGPSLASERPHAPDSIITVPAAPVNEEHEETPSSLPPQVTPAISKTPPSHEKSQPGPQPVNDLEQLREDIRQAVLPKLNAAIDSLPNSAEFFSSTWIETANKLEPMLTPTLHQLIIDHPGFPIVTVAKEFTNCVESLILLKKNSAKAYTDEW
ncbi:MAG: protein kinase [Prevotella sp.]|nr:protein kinase [Prevotella sp.]MBQ8711703.1 protein kinase [Prevotella sp.]